MIATIASRVAARRSSGASSQPATAAASSGHRAGAALEGQQRSRRLRDDLRQRRRHLAEPAVARHDGQRAAGGGLGGDHPERLGERARDDHRLGRGQQVGELGVIEAAGPHDAIGGRGVTRRCVVEEGAQVLQLQAVLAAHGAGRAARSPASASSPSRNAPKPTITSLASGTRSTTSGQAASSRSTPLEAISLPTKTTRRSSGSIAASASAAARGSRAKEEASSTASVSRSRCTSALEPAPRPRRARAA